MKIYVPRKGDVVLVEAGAMPRPKADHLKAEVQAFFGDDVDVKVLVGAHIAGVVRPQSGYASGGTVSRGPELEFHIHEAVPPGALARLDLEAIAAEMRRGRPRS
jgi:hypothetical protein